MKQCPKCSAKNRDTARFCESCGEDLTNVSVIQEDAIAAAGSILGKVGEALNSGMKKAQHAAADGMEKAKEYQQEASIRRKEAVIQSNKFVDPDETAQATIGASYLQNVLSGGQVERGSAVLTEKRIYYYGKSFSGVGKNTRSSTEEAIIPIEEVSLTRFIHGRSSGYLVAGILLLLIGIATITEIVGIPIVVVGIYFFIRYFIGRTTVFEIAFPGGKYYFDVKWYPIVDMQNFQRQLHLARDYLKND